MPVNVILKKNLEQLLKYVSTFDQKSIEHVLDAFTQRTVKKNQILLSAGEVCNEFYFVNTGCLRTYFITKEGHESTNDLEKFTSAHYLARHQNNVQDKLHWDKLSLDFALKLNTPGIKAAFPSLYLNIAKCYEDMNDLKTALEHYELADSFKVHLPKDGYGNLITEAIKNGLGRMKIQTNQLI